MTRTAVGTMGEDGSVKDMKKSDAACRAVQGKAAR